jgi:hypothetical protein
VIYTTDVGSSPNALRHVAGNTQLQPVDIHAKYLSQEWPVNPQAMPGARHTWFFAQDHPGSVQQLPPNFAVVVHPDVKPSNTPPPVFFDRSYQFQTSHPLECPYPATSDQEAHHAVQIEQHLHINTGKETETP